MSIKLTPTSIESLVPRSFVANLKLTVGMIAIIAVIFSIYVWSEKKIDSANNLRYQSQLLTSELRQSSDDLSRMVRTYVATGNPIYKKYYQDILDIRDGKIPRPRHYNQVYWDLVITGEKLPSADTTQAIALLDLMKQAHFPEQEFKKLAESKAQSDKLTEIEFKAVKLLETSTSQDVTSKNNATLMLHDSEYLQAKSNIMKPINEVITMMDKRTYAAVHSAEVLARNLRLLLIGFILGLIFILFRLYSILKGQLGGSLREVQAEIAKIGSADFTSVINVPLGKENSILGWLAKTQSNLIKMEHERKQSQNQLRDNEARLRLALISSDQSWFDFNIATGEVSVSPEYPIMLGFDPNNFQASLQDWQENIHPEDRIHVNELFQQCMKGRGPISAEYRRANSEGDWLWINSIGSITEWDQDHQPLRMIGIHTNINQRKQAELLLRNSEQRLKFVLEGSDLGFWDWDIPSGKVLRNKMWAEMLGYTYEEIEFTTQQWADFVHPDDVQDAWKSIHDALDGRTSGHELVYRMRTKNGEYKWILDRAKVVQRDADGTAIRMTGSHADYTKRKQAEVSLKESEFRWKFAIEGSGDGVWDWNIQTNEKIFSLRWKEILGYDELDSPTSNPQWDNRIHPEDKSRAEKAMQDYLDGITSTYTFEGRMQCKNGAYKWAFSRGIVVSRDDTGTALRMIGTLSDITARKHLELELTRQAHLDYLTGLSNRRHFMAQGEVELSRAIRYDTPLSLLMVDVDFFKKVNDTYGHQVGDTVLQALSKVCQDTLRHVDIAGRIGGEEFAIILPETSSKEALEVAERLRKAIANMEVKIPVGLPINFTVSIGVTTLHDKNVNIDMLLNQADKALYEAKETGRNKVCVR